jgi:hypothetical protein
MGVRRDATVVEVIIIDAVDKKLTLLDCKSSEFSSERDPHKPVSAIQTHFCPLKVV